MLYMPRPCIGVVVLLVPVEPINIATKNTLQVANPFVQPGLPLRGTLPAKVVAPVTRLPGASGNDPPPNLSPGAPKLLNL